MTAGGTVDAPIGRHPTQRTRMAVLRGRPRGGDALSRAGALRRSHLPRRAPRDRAHAPDPRAHGAPAAFPIVGRPDLRRPPARARRRQRGAAARRCAAFAARRCTPAHPVPASGERRDPASSRRRCPRDMRALLAALAGSDGRRGARRRRWPVADGLDLIQPDWPAPGRRARRRRRRAPAASARGPWRSLNLGSHVGDEPGRRGREPPPPARRTRPAGRAALAEPGARRHGRVRAGVGGRRPTADAMIAHAPGRGLRRADRRLPAGALLQRRRHPRRRRPRRLARPRGRRARGHGGGARAARRRTRQPAWPGSARPSAARPTRSAPRSARPSSRRTRRPRRASRPTARGRWQLDLPALARRRLAAAGVGRVSGGDLCTASDPERFFSYRRDGSVRPAGDADLAGAHGVPGLSPPSRRSGCASGLSLNSTSARLRTAVSG